MTMTLQLQKEVKYLSEVMKPYAEQTRHSHNLVDVAFRISLLLFLHRHDVLSPQGSLCISTVWEKNRFSMFFM